MRCAWRRAAVAPAAAIANLCFGMAAACPVPHNKCGPAAPPALTLPSTCTSRCMRMLVTSLPVSAYFRRLRSSRMSGRHSRVLCGPALGLGACAAAAGGRAAQHASAGRRQQHLKDSEKLCLLLMMVLRQSSKPAGAMGRAAPGVPLLFVLQPRHGCFGRWAADCHPQRCVRSPQLLTADVHSGGATSSALLHPASCQAGLQAMATPHTRPRRPVATHEDAAQLIEHPMLGRILQAARQGGGSRPVQQHEAQAADELSRPTPRRRRRMLPAPALTRRFRCFLGPRTILPAAARGWEGGQGLREAAAAPGHAGAGARQPRRRCHHDVSALPSVPGGRAAAAGRPSKAEQAGARGRHAPPPTSTARWQGCTGRWPPRAAASALQPPMPAPAHLLCPQHTRQPLHDASVQEKDRSRRCGGPWAPARGRAVGVLSQASSAMRPLYRPQIASTACPTSSIDHSWHL